MAKGGKVSSKRRVKPRIRSDDKGSDDSDEDYVVSDEEKLASEDLEEYCSSLEASDEEEEEEEDDMKWARKNNRSRGKKSVDRFIVDEEDEEELNVVRKKGRSGTRKGTDRFVVDEEEDEPEEEEVEDEVRRVRKNGRSRVSKGKDRSIVDEVEDELEDEDEEEEEEEGGEEEEAMKETRKAAGSKSQNSLSDRHKNEVNRRTKTEEMADQDYEEEEVEEEEDEDNAEYDEEFTPDEDECSDLEEESRVKKRKTNFKVSKRTSKKKGSLRRKSNKPSRKKQNKTRTLRRKVRSDDDDYDDDDGDFMESCPPVRKKKEKKRPKKRRRYVAPSDSDPVSSGTSDRDFTISEEEREQVREAMLLCGTIEPDLGSSLPCDRIQENEIVQPPRKPHGKKGKEKIEQVKVEVVKQVCGICLSEEDKRRVRGTLDCCTHYFCFSCINEWGKVESRCPLCKQRFKTISKLTRAGTELREVCFLVPERDQVYQPTEEELRSYLDPYESVICTECREGGDDGLMLLCDLCDSPAHTYCVGLGHEVPEGNWYCEGCQPVALGTSSSQVQNWFTEHRTANNMPIRHSPAVSFGEGLEIDLNLLSSPRSYATQGFGISSSPLYHAGGFQAASPGTGAGAPTLSVRRLRHRQIHQLISASRMNNLASRNEWNSSANLSTDSLISETAEGRETVVQQTRTDGTFHTFFERLQQNPSPQMPENDLFSSTSHHRRQVVQDLTTTSTDRPSNGTLWPGLTENTTSGHVYTHHFSSTPDIGLDGYLSSNVVTGPSDIHREKEQLQTLVRSYLKDLSREKDLGQSVTGFQEIARTAMQTIIAACEQEHLGNDVIPVQPPSPCSHIELMAGKTSMMRGCCSSCFAQFVEGVVKLVMEQKQASWLTLGLCSS